MRRALGPVRIICVGSRLDPRDDLGPRVHDRLAGQARPAGVELVDGGLQGLNLLGALEGARQVVLVDTVADAAPGEVVRLEASEAAAGGARSFGHGSGLTYLLEVLPHYFEGAPPPTLVVGAGAGADERTLERVAAVCLAAAGEPQQALAQGEER